MPGPTKQISVPGLAEGDMAQKNPFDAAALSKAKMPKGEEGKGKKTSAKKQKDDVATNGNGAEGSAAEVDMKKRKRKGKGEDDVVSTGDANDTGAEKSKKASKTKSDDDKKSPKKKTKKAEGGEEETPGKANGVSEKETAEKDPMALDNFGISSLIQDALKTKGILSLFPIQAQTYNIVLGGNDLVARARTGQGKTLAFVLPILEKLLQDSSFRDARRGHGRVPRVIVLAPTRELAKQVGADFEFLGQAVKLQTVCVYGGAPMGAQESALRRGVDVVVGTPGRVKDLLQRGSLSLKSLSFRVLDEADEMLNMGFVDDVETILGAVEDVATVQTLLFSATIPTWVNQIATRFLKAGKKTVDLVGEEKLKASASVRHLLLTCHWTQRNQVVTDLISCYSRGGRVIVFTETKNDATALSEGLSHVGARPLHGDIPQNQREQTLAGFRANSFQVLVATDVAARGLDINDVQLVVQCSPPQTEETYIHRSGRTGRAGATGVSVMLSGGKKDYMIDVIERKAGVKFERISVPQPTDIAKASATNASMSVRNVSESVVPLFRGAAEQLVADSGASPLDLLAKALAKISGQTELKRRSLLTAHDDATTLYFKAPTTTLRTRTYVFATLRRLLPQETVDRVRRMTLTSDGNGAVFDVPSDLVDQFLDAVKAEGNADAQAPISLETPDSLPELQNRPQSDRSEQGGFARRGGSSGGHGRGGDRRGGDRRGGGRGRGHGRR